MMENLLKKFLRYSSIGPALTRFYICPHIKLHHIKQSDDDFHTHPWNGISIIFGSYVEDLDGIHSKKWFFNYIHALIPHKVIVDKPVWTLFINFRRFNENWKYGTKTKPWEGSDQEREKLA